MEEYSKDYKLKKHVKKLINKIEKQIGGEKIRINTKFEKGSASSVQGDYAFFSNGEYHYLETEKGVVMSEKMTSDIEEIAYWVLDTNIFCYVVDFAAENRGNRKEDFRRLLFEKELEIYSILGQKYYEKKKKSIEEILKKSPYVD